MTAAIRSGFVVVVTLLVAISPIVGLAGAAATDGPAVQRAAGGPDTPETSADSTGVPGQSETGTEHGANETRNGSGEDNITFVEPDETEITEVDYEPDYTVEFPSGPYTPEPGLDPAVTDSSRDRVWVLLQFVASPYASTLEGLSEDGYRDVGMLTETTRYAEIPVERAEAIAANDSVRAVTAIRPEWKMGPAFRERLAETPGDERIPVAIRTFANFSGSTVDALELRPVSTREGGITTYYGNLTPGNVEELQYEERVMWIEGWSRPTTAVSEGRRLVGAHMAEQAGPGSRSGYTGQGARIGVLDTGINHSHRHFDSVTIVNSKDWFGSSPGNPDFYPDAPGTCDHGTHVAGTIAGEGFDRNRSIQIRGVAADATLVVSNAFDDNCDWVSKPVGLKKMFNKIDNNNVDVISNSWGDDTNGQYEIRASWVDTWASNNEDVLLVFSNGNSGDTSHVESPALAKNVVSVGATRDGSINNRSVDGNVTEGRIGITNDDSDLNNIRPPNDIAQGSTRRKPDLYAPGHWITAPVLNDNYGEKLGTSMAAPHVSGVAAMMTEKYPNMGANQLRAELIGTAVQPRYDGYGVVNANNALFSNAYESRHHHMSGSVKKHRGLTLTKQAKQKKKRVENDVKTFRIDQDTEKLVVTLSWLDPGNLNPGPATKLSNNLHLIVDGPGTRRVERGATNVKQVIVDNPSQGEWTITVHADQVTAFTSQDYDLVYRTITEKPTLDVESSRTVTVEPWEDRQRTVSLDVAGTGAPVSGIYMDIDNGSGVTRCDDWREPTIVGILSENHDFTKDICVELPRTSSTRTVTVEFSVNTSNAERIDGTSTQNVTRTLTFEVLPAPNEDRLEGFSGNDAIGDATNVTRVASWNHSHLRCVAGQRFSGGKGYWANCSSVLTNGPAVFAMEHWDLTLDPLSLHESGDEDYYNLSLPPTDTPKLSEPECGSQTVTMGSEQKEVETQGQLVIEVTPTANRLGDAPARIDPGGTPINVYDGDGDPVTDGTTRLLYGTRLQRTVPCPRTNASEDLTISFGEGPFRNVGSYEIEVDYEIDVKRTKDYKREMRDLAGDAKTHRRLQENPYLTQPAPESVEDVFRGGDIVTGCETHCGPMNPGGPIGPVGPTPTPMFGTQELLLRVARPGGDAPFASLVSIRDGEIAGVETGVDPAAVDATMTAHTDLHTMRMMSAAEDRSRVMAAAYRWGLLRYDAPGFLDGLYVGGFTIDLREDGAATVAVERSFDLTDEAEATAFQSMREDEDYRESLQEVYLTRMRWVAADWRAEVEREMAVRDVGLAFTTREEGTVGVMSLRVDWAGFAARTDEGLVIRRPFAEDFVTDRQLLVRGPEGHRLEGASLEPARVDEGGATWEPGVGMSDFGVQFVPVDPPAETETTDATPTEEPATDAIPTEEPATDATPTGSPETRTTSTDPPEAETTPADPPDTGGSAPDDSPGTEGDTTTADASGFGVVATVLALLVAAALARRRE